MSKKDTALSIARERVAWQNMLLSCGESEFNRMRGELSPEQLTEFEEFLAEARHDYREAERDLVRQQREASCEGR